MASTFAKNFTDIVEEKAHDIARAVNDPKKVREVLSEAQTEARERTGVPDTFPYRATVLFLGSALIAVILAQVWITVTGKETPDGLIAIGSAAIGALAGLLAPSPTN